MKCPSCGKALWFVQDVCPFCKNTIAHEPNVATIVRRSSGVLAVPVTESVGGSRENLVTLTKCGSLPEADAIRSQLEAANITSFLPDEALMQTVAWNVNTYGFIRVQVFSQDYEMAKQLLNHVQPDADQNDSEPDMKLVEQSLSWPMKCFAFTMPLLTVPGLFIFATAKGGYSRQGRDRKAAELSNWFIGGLVFWVIVLIAFMFKHEPMK